MYTHTYIHKHNNTNNAQHLTPCSCGLPPFPRRSTRSRRGRTASTHAMGTILCYIYVYVYIYIYICVFVLCINMCIYIYILLYMLYVYLLIGTGPPPHMLWVQYYVCLYILAFQGIAYTINAKTFQGLGPKIL